MTGPVYVMHDAPHFACPVTLATMTRERPFGHERPCAYVGTAAEVSRHLRAAHYWYSHEVVAWRRDEGLPEEDEGE